MRAHDRTEEVIGVLHRGKPFAHGVIHGVFKGSGTGTHRTHRCPEELHTENVERLAFYVNFAHVNDALKTHKRAGGRGCHTVLPCTGFGNDALLAHALGEQRLADHVVDLVGTGVGQILTFEEHP